MNGLCFVLKHISPGLTSYIRLYCSFSCIAEKTMFKYRVPIVYSIYIYTERAMLLLLIIATIMYLFNVFRSTRQINEGVGNNIIVMSQTIVYGLIAVALYHPRLWLNSIWIAEGNHKGCGNGVCARSKPIENIITSCSSIVTGDRYRVRCTAQSSSCCHLETILILRLNPQPIFAPAIQLGLFVNRF